MGTSMMRYALIDTPIGWAALAWGEGGLVGVQLPDPDPSITERALQERFPGATASRPPRELAGTLAGIRSLLSGVKVDLSAAPLDIDRVPAFHARVYGIVRHIPAGQTLTYGEVAARLGDPRLAREVGAALGKNPWPLIVPCHRVTAAGGKLGGFSARGGERTKLALLAIEGAPVAAQGQLL